MANHASHIDYKTNTFEHYGNVVRAKLGPLKYKIEF